MELSATYIVFDNMKCLDLSGIDLKNIREIKFPDRLESIEIQK